MNPAMRALLRARDGWRKAGCPGSEAQLVLFPEHRFAVPEARHGELADRPRKCRRK